ncbi:glyoxylase-like metal-dependent hydrolase (beta-lactamase superfamily II) [Melghirimyces profundicolus]|uniref:Glyoxylase-like metal-dependent hydrolase (Beta-lactamase superfamily II) n=1 Tax=Melghirimyces profundicolus TaxID=1242148 RepID=A0A2T6BZ11_9BACL|nr:MBL fold metallo-hydrolase [Melghirimyces profundicolus]PTX61303.1 glyoxylase-like metal-dependent hydrolase (beta-lactamase superfamily II) [Melghirimyces profundicolus]
MRSCIQRIQGIHSFQVPTPFPVGPVNVYLIEDDALTLIDAGPKSEAAWTALKRQLKEVGYVPEDIDQVVLTHHHVDHVGLLDYLGQESPIDVLGHWRNEPWISQDPAFFENSWAFFKKLYRSFGVEERFLPFLKQMFEGIFRFNCQTGLDTVLKEGDAVPGMTDWRVMETPGHAQSHIALYRERDGVMIGGDHLLAHISSNAVMEPPYPGEAERPKALLQYRESLRKMLPLDLSRVLTGHGEEVTGVHELIGQRLQKQDERATAIRAVLDSGPLSGFDICKRLFPSKYESELSLVLSETLGHLDLIQSRGEVKVMEENGVCYYSAVYWFHEGTGHMPFSSKRRNLHDQ